MSHHFAQGTKLERASMHLFSKLFASCTTLLVFGIMTVGWNLYELSKLIANKGVLFLFFPYAIGFSLLADWLASRAGFGRIFLLFLFYIAGGYLPFIVIAIWNGSFFFSIIYVFFAGTIGMLCAIAHLGMSNWVMRLKLFGIAAAICLAVLTTVLLLGDFSIKKGVVENYTDTSYSVRFDYFYGEHKVPVDLQEGTIMHYEIFWEETNHGGYGHYMLDPKGHKIGRMASPSSEMLSFEVSESGRYYFVITGEEFAGKIRVERRIEAVTEQH